MNLLNKCLNITFGKALNISVPVSSIVTVKIFNGPVIAGQIAGPLESLPFKAIGKTAVGIAEKIIK